MNSNNKEFNQKEAEAVEEGKIPLKNSDINLISF